MEKKTIAVRLKGGLGNQLFQYAAGRCLASKLECELVLLKDFFDINAEGFTQRTFELDQFVLSYKIADRELSKQLAAPSRIQRLAFWQQPQIVTEQNFFSLHPKKRIVLLDGYFQSEKYFSDCRGELIKEIRASLAGFPEIREHLKMIQEANSIAVHVRRGDYVSLKSATEFHGLLGMDYFNRAISFIRQREVKTRFFIFSDDLDWCKKNFPATDDFVFMENTGTRSGADMLLMSRCRHQIISNSSYSWWAAWLNDNKDKKVIAPKNWFNVEVAGHSDIYCADWIQL